jgi:NAD(P)-dependent dehydrogenase (short-subunit alcohol dehydrogenase family)
MTTIALITGANKGIGLETARLLGARGHTVLLGCRDADRGRAAEAELRAGGADAHALSLDVTDEDSILAAAKRIEAEYGHLDILINNAGIVAADGAGRPSETTLATLRRVFETNVFGVVAVTNVMLPLLREAPAARIVNVSSEVGSITSTTNPESPLWNLTSVPYPASKTALNMVTAMYAKELRDTPILVNAANPGYCATDLNGHHGFREARQGAEVSVHLATLPAGGPSGQLWGDLALTPGGEPADGVLPW